MSNSKLFLAGLSTQQENGKKEKRIKKHIDPEKPRSKGISVYFFLNGYCKA